MVPPFMSLPDPDRPESPGQLTSGERYRLQTWFLGILAFATVLVMLVQARFILVSLVFAIIIFSLTTDAINSIARLRIGSWRVTNFVASFVAYALIAGGLFTLVGLVVAQVNAVVTQTIAISDQAVAALGRMAAFMGPDAEAAVVASIRSVDLSGWLRTAAGQAGNLVSGVTLVILFVGFLFGERLFFNTKLENLMGDRAGAQRVGRIIRSIIRRINHYLVVKTLVSLVTAAAVWGVMVGFSLEFAVAMAILTFVLNYLPSVGSIIATIVVALVAYLQFPEPAFGVLILVIVGLIQFILGTVIDPMLMGRALRVSAFGIIMSLAFWGFLWGVPGAFLAVPILVTIMIVCAHIPAARPVAILISREGLPEFEDDDLPGEAAVAAPSPLPNAAE